VVTNALVIDWSGIYKADIGVKGGKIVGIGKAGNPDTMDGITDHMIVGSSTEVRPMHTGLLHDPQPFLLQVIAGEKLIVTAGAIDAHVHYICTDLWKEVYIDSFKQSLASLRRSSTGISFWNDNLDWRRYWSSSWNQRDNMHFIEVLHEDHDGCDRWNPHELCLHG
jgi:N-acyl-D-aspartate/D-glutamate deacylase